jgi:hypothetical protein
VPGILEIDLDTLPQVLFVKKRCLPSMRGIYFALTADKKALYIGESIDIHWRWCQPKGHECFRKVRELGCTTIAWHVEEDDARRLWIERHAIVAFRPVFNRSVVSLASASSMMCEVFVDGQWLMQCNVPLGTQWRRVRFHTFHGGND